MQIFILLSLALVAAWATYSRWSEPRRRSVPPGPPRLPIVGNILQLGPNPHKSFAHLAKTYGPLMSLHLGNQFAVVVSSPEMATEVLQKQGLVFANPFNPVALRVLGHDENSVAMLPSSSATWKKLRRVARERLFSHQALQASQGLRHERLRRLIDRVGECRGAMNVGEATFTTMSNIMFATLFSADFGGGAAASKVLREHVNSFTRYIGLPNISDFFPIFAPFDPQGIKKKVIHHLGGLLEIVSGMIEQRLQARKESNYQKKNDFLETLLDLIQGHEYDLSIEEIKHLCVDLLISGSDTSAATTEWAMVELLLHPDKLAKLKAELKSVIGDQTLVEESDISRLPYLQATIKEVLRYHPAAPLLAPHVAEEETQLDGYLIPKNTKMFVNVWAITRDPTIWKDPERFEPERFLDKDIDFSGQHFELIPFSSGRRICPGMALASRMLPCMVAALCHNFDWELERGNESKRLQREDVFGLALQKKTPLWAIPIKV
ncbi:carnosic acid synthase-like [Salvia miltiorrhiza]|uniref:carnosic acid synthase-like n=1 Tax=Salvia miltiorrhiza TaxID=226208 RepID=UPI0025ABDE87|nr:carnosic acid synthase-like [Salvia miltiorrhiza]